MTYEASTDLENSVLGLHKIQDYAPLIGSASVERILNKAARLSRSHVVHVSSTLYGGGVAEMLTPLTLLMNSLGIKTGWRVIQGTPEFFACTKKIHNALQGAEADLTASEKAIYEQGVLENSIRLHFERDDWIIVHDPQPLPVVRHFEDTQARWIWQCHLDLSQPNRRTCDYLRPFVEQYAWRCSHCRTTPRISQSHSSFCCRRSIPSQQKIECFRR